MTAQLKSNRSFVALFSLSPSNICLPFEVIFVACPPPVKSHQPAHYLIKNERSLITFKAYMMLVFQCIHLGSDRGPLASAPT